MVEKTILDNIREQRERLGLSQAAIAEEIGIGRTSYINFEKGKINIFCKTLYLFCEYCGISVEDLICKNYKSRDLLEDHGNFNEQKKALIEDYEKRLSSLNEKYQASQRIIEAHEITIKTLNETKDFLLSQLHKND